MSSAVVLRHPVYGKMPQLLGEPAWMQRIIDRLNFGHTLRREGWFTHEKA